MARRHLSLEQRRELIRQQLQSTPEKSDRQIAKDLNIADHKAVSRQRKTMESIGALPQCDRTTSDGRTYPKERKPVSVFNPTKREEKALTNPKVVEQVAISGSVMAAQKDIERAERQELIKEQIEKPKTSAHIDIFTTDKKYRVIYADPPWQYNDKQDTSKLGGAEKKYPTMPLKDICSLPVPTEGNAVLFLWVTSPMLEDAFQVIHAWGFSYKSSFIWDKVAHNMGHYNSVRHEFLLICTKGSCTPDVPKLLDSVVSIERTEHSVKPKEFRDMIDMLYPVGERLEMFAREAAPGWDVWGNMA
jgi:N6-adenosine-specific RNA methylase IME4